jgi:menaquinone-dependent protoporphyrinogen oxidase
VAFENETGWHPAQVALFAGALPYTRYGFLKRHLMKKIAGDKPGSLGTDTSRDYVYTDWNEVSRFTEDFLERLPSRTPRGLEESHSVAERNQTRSRLAT